MSLLSVSDLLQSLKYCCKRKKLTVDFVVTAHHTSHPGFDGVCERPKIELVHGPVINTTRHGFAVLLLLVQYIMLSYPESAISVPEKGDDS